MTLNPEEALDTPWISDRTWVPTSARNSTEEPAWASGHQRALLLLLGLFAGRWKPRERRMLLWENVWIM